MEPSDFVPVLAQIFLAIGIGVVTLIASHIFGKRARPGSKIKDTAYECGLPAEGASHTRFSVKFYVTAMLFILFDIEIIFLVPWAIVYREFLQADLPILGPVLFFLAVLVIGMIYEFKKGALEWEK